MSAEEVLPCWSCGGPVRLIVLRGVLSAKCRRDFTECAGAAYDTPVKLWNLRTPPAMSADHIPGAGKMAHVLRGMVNRGTLIDADTILDLIQSERAG